MWSVNVLFPAFQMPLDNATERQPHNQAAEECSGNSCCVLPIIFSFMLGGASSSTYIFDKKIFFLPHMNKTTVLVTWRTLVLCRVYSFALCHSSPEIFGVTVSRCVLENQLQPLFLKIGLLVWFFHHNFVICKVTAIKLWMLQAYTNGLVLFYGYL